MSEPDLVLELDTVCAGYGETQVLENITLRIRRGERVAVIGRNGVGKTTLLATMMGLTRLHSGTLRLNGREITGLPTYLRSQAGLGLVPQTRDIFPSLTVEENLRAAMRGGTGLDDAYDLFPRLKERRANGGADLSGGEQQMLSIARALMARPEILLLDEPLEGLAPVICEMLMKVFDSIARDGRRTVVLVEQHIGMALAFAERAVVIDSGRVVFDGPAARLREDPTILDRHIGLAMAH